MKKIMAIAQRLSHSEARNIAGGAIAPIGLWWCPTTNRCYSRSLCASVCSKPCQSVGTSCPWD